jgi:hypothetical protein
MKVQPTTNSPNFQYSHPLKTAYKKGLMPDVKYGIYGKRLTPQTVSLEHITPKSQGGKLTFDNLALADRVENNKRATKPINECVTKEMWIKYLRQFINVKNKFVDGIKYIKGICKKQNIKTKEVL